MRKTFILIIFLFVTYFFPAAQAFAANDIGVRLTHMYDYFTSEDSVYNTPIYWGHQWHTNVNPFNGSIIDSPIVELRTNLEIAFFTPNDSAYFTPDHESNLYTWSFNDLVMESPSMLALGAYMPNHIFASPKFTVSRIVEPEVLSDGNNLQTITVEFTLEEELPSEYNWFFIGIGFPSIPYNQQLVQGSFVWQNDIEKWDEYPDGIQAIWIANPQDIEVGITYILQAKLNSVKSPYLLGSPIFKPGVNIQYGQKCDLPISLSKSIIIEGQSETISATCYADNGDDICWHPVLADPEYLVWLNPVVFQITLDPPHHVLIPADVTMKPETLNISSKGIITAFVTLPQPYAIEDVDVLTVTCQEADAVMGKINSGRLMLKFKREDLQRVNPGENVELLVTGQLSDGTIFEGTDVIRVIE